jgi:hypothetical protein
MLVVPQAPFPRSGRLPHLGVLRFSGPDALAFLQGQLSNDTRRLATGQMLAAYSSPQGRVLALLHCLPHAGSVVALLPRELAVPTLESMRRYVLRAKVKIEDASEALAVYGAHGDELPRALGVEPPAGREHVERDAVVVARVGGGSPGGSPADTADAAAPRYWLIGPAQSLASLGSGAAPAEAAGIEHDWRLADVRDGLPQVYAATREAFVAQMLNLDVLDAISFDKGCYTGQEIIARTQHLGRIKRRMFRLQLPQGSWHVGQPLQLGSGHGGRLVEVALSASGAEALAVLGLQPASSVAPPGTSSVSPPGASAAASPAPSAAAAGSGSGSEARDADDALSEPSSAVDARILPLPYPVELR